MKKAIILLSSLFFIMMLSVIILDNLTKSNDLLDVHSSEFSNTQALLLVNNLKEEIGKMLLQNKASLELMFDDETLSANLPLAIEGMKINGTLFKLEEAYDINTIFSDDPLKYKRLEAFFVQNSVDYEGFKYFALQYLQDIDNSVKTFEFKQQLNKAIQSYVKQSGFSEMNTIIEYLWFFDVLKETSQVKYVLCELDFDVANNKYRSSFLYNIDELKENLIKVSEFEFTFK
jgi:hypothetical protein